MSYPIGIDLGTSNSVVCVRRRGVVETIAVDGRSTLPSSVALRPDGGAMIGQSARSRALLDPTSAVSSSKRSIGDGATVWKINGQVWTPVDVAAQILKRLKEAAEKHLGEPVREAVVTVPAYFNNAQKSDTRRAAEQAGLQVLQLLPEPTAAAIAYGLDKGRDQTILVYDFGGGTFDVSVLQVKGNRFQVLAVDGDFHLGGDDFDLVLSSHLLRVLQKAAAPNMRATLGALEPLLRGERPAGVPQPHLAAALMLREAAERLKIELSESQSARVMLPDILFESLDEEVTRADYNKLIEPLVARTIAKVNDVLKAAKMSRDDIDRVILVGGSTRNALVRERVAQAVKEPFTSDRVDEVVAQGAAIVAAHLSSPDLSRAEAPVEVPIEFVNVTPFALGLCIYDSKAGRYVNSVVLEANRPVPAAETKPYEVRTSPIQDNQLDAYILQGDDPDPKRCFVIGRFTFRSVKHEASGYARVDISYGYDADGIIVASARQVSTGRELPLVVEHLSSDMSWLQKPRASVYGRFAGQHSIPEAVTDRFGNAAGAQYDLAEDGAFAGQTIAVLHLYTREGFNFRAPQAALAEKGFHVHRWTKVPPIDEMRKVLKGACQLWVISTSTCVLPRPHLEEIQAFFHSGRGLYLWADNTPYIADANALAQPLFGVSLSGNASGNRVLGLKGQEQKGGFVSHLVTTGIAKMYEGVTVSNIHINTTLKPLMYGSNGRLLIAAYDRDGKRALIDGGFTRLFLKWDTAGTGRYVKNAASWLVNYERFGDQIFEAAGLAAGAAAGR